MSTVQEAPFVTAEPQAPFVMPVARMNQEVSWYPHAERHREPASARITKIGNNVLTMVTIQRYGNQEKESVRHIDDPFLKNSPEWRNEYGAWDYTPEYKERLAFEKGVLDRLSALENAATTAAPDDNAESRFEKIESIIAGLKISVGKLKKSNDESTG